MFLFLDCDTDSYLTKPSTASRGGSRAAATSKMERFVIIVNGFQPLTIITKRSILDNAAVLDPPLASTSRTSVHPSILAEVRIAMLLVHCNSVFLMNSRKVKLAKNLHME